METVEIDLSLKIILTDVELSDELLALLKKRLREAVEDFRINDVGAGPGEVKAKFGA